MVVTISVSLVLAQRVLVKGGTREEEISAFRISSVLSKAPSLEVPGEKLESEDRKHASSICVFAVRYQDADKYVQKVPKVPSRYQDFLY